MKIALKGRVIVFITDKCHKYVNNWAQWVVKVQVVVQVQDQQVLHLHLLLGIIKQEDELVLHLCFGSGHSDQLILTCNSHLSESDRCEFK